MKRLITSLGVLTLAASAFASWNVTILNSSGTLYSPATPITVPTLVQSSPIPQITFQAAIATPNPFIVGMGTGFSNGSFLGQYTINDPTNTQPYLSGFNFVMSGFVYNYGIVNWFKKVVRSSDNAILWQGSGSFLGDAYLGGSDGVFSVVIPVSLSVPANDVTVYETFQLLGGNLPGSGAALMLVEQDWTVVPEPASMIALATGLGGLLLRRRKA
ncbi:MAG: hypothetical protein KatS3mg019_0906 [Fimbriimonadales bacterium]|nr:MAG: hypothetical protein KatS3mg019_0906 [Fimbriimonadales bacterium]